MAMILKHLPTNQANIQTPDRHKPWWVTLEPLQSQVARRPGETPPPQKNLSIMTRAHYIYYSLASIAIEQTSLYKSYR